MARMLTLKQLEALRWVAQLGTFEKAAVRLNTTQSAISKRIQELEDATGSTMFDRSQRRVRLTEAGIQALSSAQEMLRLRDNLLTINDRAPPTSRLLRVGVTELAAMTWLPRLVSSLRSAHPEVQLAPEVDMSRNLFDRLLEDTIDLVVIPESFFDPRISSVRLAEVHNSWMASPELLSSDHTLTLEELGNYTILVQGNQSGSGMHFDKWIKSRGLVFPKEISTNSILAVVGFTLAGLGVSYLPRMAFDHLIAAGKLRIVATTPLLPPVPYGAMYRNDRDEPFIQSMVRAVRDVCDFTVQSQR